MKGLELAKRYYEEYGRSMIDEQFPEFAARIAVGLVGEGSECLGFDDEISQDHDFEPGFCLFITREDEREFGFKLERAYAKLPKEFMGFTRQPMSPVGGNRHGVLVIEDFYEKHLGTAEVPEDPAWWLCIPSHNLLTVSSGGVWRDDLAIFSAVRENILQGYPQDVLCKKIAAHTLFAAQAGQYNYPRLIRRGELGAAQLALFEFVKHVISLVYLINQKYEPFYKWAYRGMRSLEKLGFLEKWLSDMTQTDNTPANADDKIQKMEEISAFLIAAFREMGITQANCNQLETHAYSVLDSVRDSRLRNMHIMAGI